MLKGIERKISSQSENALMKFSKQIKKQNMKLVKEEEDRDCNVPMNNWHLIARSVKIRKCWFKRVNCYLKRERERERDREREHLIDNRRQLIIPLMEMSRTIFFWFLFLIQFLLSEPLINDIVHGWPLCRTLSRFGESKIEKNLSFNPFLSIRSQEESNAEVHLNTFPSLFCGDYIPEELWPTNTKKPTF